MPNRPIEKSIFKRNIKNMEECKRQGYGCGACESREDCECRTSWYCETCHKKSTFKTVRKVVFG